MSDAERQVVDENGARYRLGGKPIGRGGQGAVWRVEGGRRIVKIMNPGRDPEAMRRQFLFVRRLDLKGLHVAKPLAVLRPPLVGYVAEFLEDMVPLKLLMEAPKSGLVAWHLATGSLRRRLRLLAHSGEALMGLHAKGVIYADVSHNNVFVSEPVHATEAWLIDLDNLAHDSDRRRAIYTPGYGAPELVKGQHGCTSLSDAWAFAVLVWSALALEHPFVGDMVDDDPELEPQAFAAELPWVMHSTNDENECSVGLPPELVLGTRLIELARRCFELGIDDRTQRPSVGEWVERLHAAADQTVVCPACGGTYLVTEHECTWCEAPRPGLDVVRLRRWVPGAGIVRPATRMPQLPVTADPLRLSKRLTQGIAGVAGRAPHVAIRRLPSRGFLVEVAPGEKAWVADRDAPDRVYEVEGRGRRLPKKGWLVFFESPDRAQRVALVGGAP